ncbi:MAG: VCBS repeat-containing protein, partial [Planctomycetota bacterium]|nr:VCBS repeat-containing protein [Planctomycetota bacterium]
VANRRPLKGPRMRLNRAVPAVAFAAAVLAFALLADAVIEIKMPVSRIYDTAKAVAVGTITGASAETGVAEVKVAETLKGDPLGDRVRVQIVAPEELMSKIAAGQPVVFFIARASKGLAVIHIADAWLHAQLVSDSNPPVWRTVQAFDGKGAFPGRTATLVRLVGDMKAGRADFLNKAETEYFRGGVKELAKLGVRKPTLLLAADFSGDKKPDLVVAAPDGVKLFIATAAGYEDATEKWGLAGASATSAAAADVNGDGKPDLLLGGTIWMNEGGKFAAAKPGPQLPADAKPLAAALLDVNGDGKPDAAFLLPTGQLLVFENPGAPGKPWPQRPARALWQDGAASAAVFGDWGDNGKPHVMVVRAGGITRYALDAGGGPPADYERLTGEARGPALKDRPEALKGAAVAAGDIDGGGRKDFLLAGNGWDLALVSRGYGAFLAIADGAAALRPKDAAAPLHLGPATVWTLVDMNGDGRDDLLCLTEDGRLFVADNPAPPTAAAH